ncbi:MAG: DUF3793 family protein [Clostridia bacterium]|nr:DUF3793 family protein [Clostridia bacterium]MBQ1435351.1 DUF3793 family protein [Clostridia bacterium]
MLEECLIKHCAPTLASLKTASLFTVKNVSEGTVQSQLEALNMRFNEKGVFLTLLRFSGGCALIYVYRGTQLSRDLKRKGVERFLSSYGYTGTDMAYAIDHLKTRLKEGEGFPHEIGIFLGYPLADVVGFIANDGKNCKYCGYWKVYCNVCEARKLFERIRKCRAVYSRLWHEGRSVLQLTVAA